MSAAVQRTAHGAAMKKTAANRVQEELLLSLKQTNSLPELLTTAPFAINFLGQIKLLAFSDNALRISLQRPEGGRFKHLDHPSLAAAMLQIVDQASNAFDTASRNMDAIDKDASSLFGRNSLAADILSSLQDPNVARKRLKPDIESLRSGMDECAQRAQDIEQEFQKLRETAEELSRAMGNQATTTRDEEIKTDEELRRTDIEKQIQHGLQTSIEREFNRADEDLEKARKVFHKVAKRGEWRALGFKTASDIESGFAGLINGAVGLVKDTPRVVTTALEAAGALGGAAARFVSTGSLPSATTSTGGPSSPVNVQKRKQSMTSLPSEIGIDPAIVNAEQISSRVLDLYLIIQGDLLHTLQEEGADQGLLECSEHLKACRAELGESNSQNISTTKVLLDKAVQTTTDILGSRKLASSVDANDSKWKKKVEKWTRDAKDVHGKVLKLNAKAAAQAGQGFGDTLDIPQPSTEGTNIDFTSILKARHQKLLVMRGAMQQAQQNLQMQTDRHKDTQARAIEIASSLEKLKLEQVALKDIRSILLQAIDTVTHLQREIRQLTLFFNFMSTTISILGRRHTDRYIRAVESGISDNGIDFGLSYGDVQVRMIRETILLLRGHFAFIVESARLYQNISAQYIIPCMRKTADLKVGDSVEKQNEARADLKNFTEECAQSIRHLAQKEFENIQGQLMSRCVEIDDELQSLRLPAPENYVQQAIEEGVKEASAQIPESYVPEIDDNIFG